MKVYITVHRFWFSSFLKKLILLFGKDALKFIKNDSENF